MDNSIIANRIVALTADIAEQLCRIKTITGSAKFSIYDMLDAEKLIKSINVMIQLKTALSEILDDSLTSKNWNKEEIKPLNSAHGFPDNQTQYF
jgi:hypothetical protein